MIPMDMMTYISFVGAAILLVIAPGPDSMYILTKSLSSGARKGITLAWGLATGPIWHTFLVMVGVAAFIQHSPMAFKSLTYCGAAYLLYLSYGAFRAKAEPIVLKTEAADHTGNWFLYRRGLFMNASNPKVLLFFLALLPQFIDKNAAFSPSIQIGLMGLTFSLLTGVIFSLYAICAGKLRNSLAKHQKFPYIMNKVEGTLLLLIAVGLLFL